MTGAAPAGLRCRPLRAEDAPAALRLLRAGFPDRTEAYWATALDRLLRHAAARAMRPGVVLEAPEGLVGVLLLIPGSDPEKPRANVSSWTVDPRYAGYAPLLANQAIRDRALTYFNVSPAPHTRATIEAQGFVPYSQGRIVALPALMATRPGVRVRPYDPADPAHAGLPDAERALLERHVGYGCLAVIAEEGEDRHPFLFLRWRVRKLLPGAQLVYCRDIADLVRVGGPVGRFLLRRGMVAVLVDACGPADGLPGSRIPDRSPKYVKGAHPPRTGDLTDTELVMFGP